MPSLAIRLSADPHSPSPVAPQRPTLPTVSSSSSLISALDRLRRPVDVDESDQVELGALEKRSKAELEHISSLNLSFLPDLKSKLHSTAPSSSRTDQSSPSDEEFGSTPSPPTPRTLIPAGLLDQEDEVTSENNSMQRRDLLERPNQDSQRDGPDETRANDSATSVRANISRGSAPRASSSRSRATTEAVRGRQPRGSVGSSSRGDDGSRSQNSSRDSSSHFSNPETTSSASASDSQRVGTAFGTTTDVSRPQGSGQIHTQPQQNIAQSLLTSGSLPLPPGISASSFADFLRTADLPSFSAPAYVPSQSQSLPQSGVVGPDYFPTSTQFISSSHGGSLSRTAQGLGRGAGIGGSGSGLSGSASSSMPQIDYSSLTPEQQEVLVRAHEQILLMGAQQLQQQQHRQQEPQSQFRPPQNPSSLPSDFRSHSYNPSTELSLRWNERQVQQFIEATRVSVNPAGLSFSPSSVGGLHLPRYIGQGNDLPSGLVSSGLPDLRIAPPSSYPPPSTIPPRYTYTPNFASPTQLSAGGGLDVGVRTTLPSPAGSGSGSISESSTTYPSPHPSSASNSAAAMNSGFGAAHSAPSSQAQRGVNTRRGQGQMHQQPIQTQPGRGRASSSASSASTRRTSFSSSGTAPGAGAGGSSNRTRSQTTSGTAALGLPTTTPGAGSSSGRRGPSASASASASAGEGGDVDGPEGFQDKRRRNTAASARFRIKKKQRILSLESTIHDLAGRAEDLEKEAGELRKENNWLKEMVILKGRKTLGRLRGDSEGVVGGMIDAGGGVMVASGSEGNLGADTGNLGPGSLGSTAGGSSSRDSGASSRSTGHPTAGAAGVYGERHSGSSHDTHHEQADDDEDEDDGDEGEDEDGDEYRE